MLTGYLLLTYYNLTPLRACGSRDSLEGSLPSDSNLIRLSMAAYRYLDGSPNGRKRSITVATRTWVGTRTDKGSRDQLR